MRSALRSPLRFLYPSSFDEDKAKAVIKTLEDDAELVKVYKQMVALSACILR
jgi:hypothetical protein|tara:strand:- start:320 stop:475 length:156 start_codon:yes stop_codon:yes gene_type:complete